jgi:signal transduction histidine kinase
MVDENSGRILQVTARPIPAPQATNEHDDRGQHRAEVHWPLTARPWRLRNWRVRWRVLALILVPTVTAITLGGFRIQEARDTSSTFGQVNQLATLGGELTSLVQAIEDERDLTAGYLTAHQLGEPQKPKGGGNPADAALATSIFAQLGRLYAVTNARETVVEKAATRIGSGFPAVARTDLAAALSQLSALPSLREFVSSQISALPMIQNYSNVIEPLIAFDNDIASGSSNAQLAQSVSAFSTVAQLEDQASQQRAIVYGTVLQNAFEPGVLTALTTAQSNQASDLATFQATAANLPAYFPASAGAPAGFSATETQTAEFNDIVAGPGVDQALATEQNVIIAGQSGGASIGSITSAQDWFANMTDQVDLIRSFENDQLDSITAQASSLQRGAESSERLTAIIVLVLLLLVLLVTSVVAQSMVRPLRKLRTDALDVADHRLPDIVRRLSESEDPATSVQIEPIGVDSTDEIGEVARAFDRVHREAVRLAGDEAMLRANLNAIFVNLSRRSQTLIERQLGIIESLEQSEQDADRLSSLFRLDHLATRMRRNSENLLVLAGHEAPRKWTEPVPLVDVLRAAISEIEQYDRVTLNVQSGLVIVGRAASDVVHLVAELVENATTFSSREAPVLLTGQQLSSGGVLIDISDEGLGIPEEELAYANWRLDNPPVIDVAVSRRMGLFVVGRLAARHGVRVRLRRASLSGGMSALIWVPDGVVKNDYRPLTGAGRPYDFSARRPSTPVLRTARRAKRRKSVWFDTGNGDAASAGAGTGDPGSADSGNPVTTVTVVTPPAELESGPDVPDADREAQLPIYDSIESEWFRRGNTSFSDGGRAKAGRWMSAAADEGFRVARTVVSPVTGQLTNAGLPRRVPNANLVPGSIGEQRARPAPAGDAPSRSAEAARARLTGFQTRRRDGRADASQWPGADED